MEFILVSKVEQIATITLNRPDKRNAMHAPLIKEVLQALKAMANDTAIRVLILNGNGDNFCAGGDIGWMQKIATGTDAENYDDAQLLADLLFAVYTFPKPTIVLAQGAVLGGGLGVLAAADIAIASKEAMFGLPEVKIGITPSMISPYMIAAIGERAAHYYFLTGERFNAERAFQLGLIHQIAENEALQSIGISLAKKLLENNPKAMAAAKHLISYVAKETITAQLAQKTAEHLAELRATPQAQEGLKAFLEKRKPQWD